MNELYNIQTEESIIGCIMIMNGYGEAVDNAIESLNPQDFYSLRTKEIFTVIKDIYNKKINPDPNTIYSHHLMSDRDTYAYALEIQKNTASGSNLNHFTEKLLEYSQIRAIQGRVNAINEIMCENGDIKEKLDRIDDIFSIETGVTSNSDGFKHISEIMPRYVDSLEKRWNNPDEVVFSTGIPDLDVIFDGGLEVGLHAIAARPKMGKTELMTTMLNHFAITRGLPICIASLEMADTQMIERSVSSLGGIDKKSIKNNFVNEFDHELAFGAFGEACSKVRNSNIYVNDSHSNSPKNIRRGARMVKKKHGYVGGIFVDYLGLLDADGKHDRHDLSIASITKALKALSKEFNCPVVLLLQLNRALESRSDKRPIPSDSRDSGAIEQDVDSWTAIYRDSVYDEESEWKNITEIIVRLNRHGETGTAYQAITGRGFVNVSIDDVAQISARIDAKRVKNTDEKRF